MKIIADENLKDIERHFSEFGDIELLAGREIDADAARHADVLLVRSVTPVTQSLLDGSQVKFVGTATSGTNHVDQHYLGERGIFFAHAHGSNAQAVVDYCLSAIFGPAAQRHAVGLDKVGIVGLGAVGFLFAKKLRLLGYKVNFYDPLLSEEKRIAAANEGLNSTDDLQLIFESDLVSIHTPLSREGEFPTYHMVTEGLLERIPSKGIFINASRGEVIDESALLTFLSVRSDVFSVLDVWENEPDINAKLMALVSLATPHIAGYSRNGKALATKMLRDSYANFRGDSVEGAHFRKEPLRLDLNPPGLNQMSIAQLLNCAMPVSDWSAQFRNAMRVSNKAADSFDIFRKSMINRSELTDFNVSANRLGPVEKSIAEKLGFYIID